MGVPLDLWASLWIYAKKAIGPLQLTEEEARTTARQAFQNNSKLTSAEIGKAIGRSRRTVDSYIVDLRAATQMELDFKIFRMNYLGIPQERIALRLGQTRDIIRDHLVRKAELPKSPNVDLKKGFTVPQVAEKHACPVGPEDRTGGCPEPLVWSIALEGKNDQDRFESLNWGLRTWDHWYFNDLDQRFGDNWPGQIPAQLVAHTLYYFTQGGDLVFDPTRPSRLKAKSMAGRWPVEALFLIPALRSTENAGLLI